MWKTQEPHAKKRQEIKEKAATPPLEEKFPTYDDMPIENQEVPTKETSIIEIEPKICGRISIDRECLGVIQACKTSS